MGVKYLSSLLYTFVEIHLWSGITSLEVLTDQCQFLIARQAVTP